jgi:hypothetical protein
MILLFLHRFHAADRVAGACGACATRGNSMSKAAPCPSLLWQWM